MEEARKKLLESNNALLIMPSYHMQVYKEAGNYQRRKMHFSLALPVSVANNYGSHCGFGKSTNWLFLCKAGS